VYAGGDDNELCEGQRMQASVVVAMAPDQDADSMAKAGQKAEKAARL
jgi:hypothetical protein